MDRHPADNGAVKAFCQYDVGVALADVHRPGGQRDGAVDLHDVQRARLVEALGQVAGEHGRDVLSRAMTMGTGKLAGRGASTWPSTPGPPVEEPTTTIRGPRRAERAAPLGRLVVLVSMSWRWRRMRSARPPVRRTLAHAAAFPLDQLVGDNIDGNGDRAPRLGEVIHRPQLEGFERGERPLVGQ